MKDRLSRKSALDSIGVCLVPTQAAGHFTVSGVQVTTQASNPSVGWRRWPRIAVAVALVVAGGVFLQARLRHPSSSVAIRATGPATATARRRLPRVVWAPAQSTPAQQVDAGPLRPPRPAPAGAARPREKAQSDSVTKGAPAAATGWIRIGGAALVGSRVSIDGAPSGFAPLERSLPVGLHHIVVSDVTTGEARLALSVTVTEANTHTAPLRLIR
jgi:hypothetical protein